MAVNAGSVFVRLSAQFDDDGFEKFERRHVKAQRAKDIKARLGGDFDDRSFDVYERRLKEVEAKASRRDAFKATLGADYNPQAFRAYERDLARAERETRQSTQRMRKAFAYGFGFLSAGGVAGAVSAVKSVTDAFGEAEVSSRKLQAQLRASGQSYREHAAEIDRVIQKTSKLAGLDDEDLQDAFTAIVRTTGSVTTAMKDMALVADLARAKNMDVAKAGELVAKIHAGNIGPLKRLGIEFAASGENVAKLKAEYKNYTPEQLAVAKAADKQADSERALSVLRAKMKGQAVEYGQTQQGAADRARVAWENLREKLGEKLAPTFTRLANRAADFINEMEAGTGQGGRFLDKMKDVGDTLLGVGKTVQKVSDWFGGFTSVVKAAAAAWVAYKAAMIAAAVAARGQSVRALFSGKPGTPAGGGGTGGGRGGAGRALGAGGAGALLGGPALALTAAGISLLDDQVSATQERNMTGFGKAVMRVRQEYEQLARTGNIKRLAADVRAFDASMAGNGTTTRNWSQALKRAGVSTGELRDASREQIAAFGEMQRAYLQMARQLREDRPIKQAASNFRDLRKSGENNMKNLRKQVSDNMVMIKSHLGEDSAEGRAGLAKNFRLARTAIREAMADGKVSVKDGMAEIRRLMRQELQAYGLSLSQIKDYQRNTGKGSGNEAPDYAGGRAGGGWIGMRGQAGGDTVPAMLGLGEAVLNRHQQEPVELALQAVYGMSLDDLFASVRRPHYLASGGIVSVPGFPGERANRSILPMISTVARKFGLTLTDAYGQGHKSPGHTKTGTAADFAGSDKAMDAAVRFLVARGYLVGYDGRFGSQAWPGHGPSYVAGGNAHLHVELGSASGGVPSMSEIKAPRTGMRGALGRIVQATLDTGARGANAVLADALAVPVAGGGGGGSSASVAQARRWIAAGLRLAGVPASARNINTILGRAQQESGLNPRAINTWDSNAKAGTPSKGLLQTIDPTFQKYKVKGHDDIWNPVDNTAAAVRYMLARYGRLVGRSGSGYSGGGFVQRFSGGGKAKKPKIVPAAMLGSSPVELSPRAMRGLERLQGPRIKRYEDWIGKATQADVEHDFLDRKFSLSEEEFILDDGSIDQGAIQQRVSELGQLRVKLADRLRALQKARKVAERIVDTYRTLVDRFSIARDALRGKRSAKRRAEYAAKVTKYSNDLSTWKSTLGEFDLGGQYSIDSAKLDITEIDRDIAGVLGTQPQASSSGDGDGGGGGGDGSDTSTTSADTPAAAPPSAEEITAAAFQQVQAATQARQEMLNSFASNFTTAFAASRPGGVFSSSPDPLALAAGARYIGATGDGDIGGAAGKTINIVNNYQQLPDDTATWSSQMRFSVEAGV